MRRWGYVIALFCIIAPYVAFAGVFRKPACGVSVIDSVGRHMADTLDFDTAEELGFTIPQEYLDTAQVIIQDGVKTER